VRDRVRRVFILERLLVAGRSALHATHGSLHSGSGPGRSPLGRGALLVEIRGNLPQRCGASSACGLYHFRNICRAAGVTAEQLEELLMQLMEAGRLTAEELAQELASGRWAGCQWDCGPTVRIQGRDVRS
jgi:hypothetical protein